MIASIRTDSHRRRTSDEHLDAATHPLIPPLATK